MTKEFIAILKDMAKEYELLAKYNGGKDYLRWDALLAAVDEAKDHVSVKKVMTKIQYTKPRVGEDNSKERFKYMQWMADKNAIWEAVNDEQTKIH